jgi:hypothetical protein
MVINIQQKDFGGRLRSGDILGICNILEHIRKVEQNTDIKYHLSDEAIQPDEYVIKFRNFLIDHTDYFSMVPGDRYFPFERLNCWDYRATSGDLVKVDNTKYQKENKVCIFPLLDAAYNFYRNWSIDTTKNLIEHYKKKYDAKIIICAHDRCKDIIETNFPGLEYSYDYMQNINHVITCKYFAGGDTATSHLASSVINKPNNLFLYSSESLFHAFPLNHRQNEMVMYSKFGCNFDGK